MTPFRFRLQTVLSSRDRTRDAARGRLAAALAALADAEARLAAATAEAGETTAEVAAASSAGRLDVNRWLDRRRHAAALASRLAAARRGVDEATAAVDVARDAAVDADRGVKALETLRDRDRAVHAARALAQEQRVAEDVWNATRGRGLEARG